jgi:hypothetical protein
MFSGQNAPHRPTMVMLIVFVLILFAAYHFTLGRKG